MTTGSSPPNGLSPKITHIVASFKYVFKLGALVMLEVLGGRGELAREGE